MAKATLPALGLGTFRLKGEPLMGSIHKALDLGYRHIDTAQMYENEETVGAALDAHDVPRDEVFLTTKIWHDRLQHDDLLQSLQESVNRLRVDAVDLARDELKATLEGLATHLFGEVEMRWVDAYFPFTEPSMELEIFFKGEWLEVLGCGVMEMKILEEAGLGDKRAWAFGLGLERLAMVLFDVPDIRLFWSDDTRFTKQFKAGMFRAGGVDMAKFKPYSKYPPCLKDVSFWLPEEAEKFTENNLCEVVRDAAGALVEEVKLIDEFENKKTGRTSNCFRIVYRSMERSLTDEEINEIQEKVRENMVAELGVELR